LGSYKSDHPEDLSLWTIERFVDEVEQVRIALGLNKDNFILLGQSWGGMLAMEYALKYQENLKGLVIDSMQASIKDYMDYVGGVLAPQLNPDSVKRIRELEAAGDFENEEYMPLLYPYYGKFVIGMPMNELPEPIQMFIGTLNHQVYGYLNGPSEFTCTGTMKDWDVKGRLKEIKVPTLVIGSTNNTMDPKQLEWMAEEVQDGVYLHLEGSHMIMWNDPENYFSGLADFLGKFK
jgi:proline iminopeptidase